MSTAIQPASIVDLTESIRDIFAQVTRYPLEILDPASSLEEDLGIDSVKLGEVFAVLREKYRISDKLNIPREQLRSIDSIAASLRAYLAQGSSAPPEVPRSRTSAPSAPRPSEVDRTPAEPQDLFLEVQEIFSAVTRYPRDILEPHASLEEDLGIDSVKLGEVFAVLRERYALPAKLDVPAERFKTIAAITETLTEYVRKNAAPAAVAASSQPSRADDFATTAPRPAAEDLAARVLGIFADVTRYPKEILDPSVSLEEDLGIDSVKLGEVFAVLREIYKLPEKLQLPRESFKSIGSITEALGQYLKSSAAPPVPLQSSKEGAIGAKGNGSRTLQSHTELLDSSFASLTPSRRPFDGKVALISGSGRALGKDIAVYLASLGATVIVNSFHSRQQGIQTVEEINAAGGKAVHAWGSVANEQQRDAIFDLIDKTFGGLDVFISNASNGMLARLREITVEHWEKAFRTNVVGLHQCALRAVELMKRRGGGKIVTLSSPASHGYVDYFGCMGAVKAAVESLTKSMAIEFAADNIQVNCVSPGPIYGDLLNKWPESERLIADWENATAYERLCNDRDVSHFIAYLLSDSVKLFTGSVLVMDGGISVRWGGVSNPNNRKEAS